VAVEIGRVGAARVFLIALDAMDPELVGELVAAGDLPAIASLMRESGRTRRPNR
jgi:hypothetical protein